MKVSLVSTAFAALLFSSWSSADPAPEETCLNILLTNDDGYQTLYIQTLFDYLKQQTCHDVVMVAPGLGLGFGKGSSVDFLTPLSSGNPYNGVYVLDSTPATTVYYGLDVVCPDLGFVPDLVISGPNEGWNLGLGGIPSGTIAAAQAAMARGLPAIAVSASFLTDENSLAAEVIADIVGRFIDEKLIDDEGELILKAGEGFNVNIPTVTVFSAPTPTVGDPADYEFELTKIGLANPIGGPKYFNDFSDCPIAVGFSGGALNGEGGLCAVDPYTLAGYPEDNDPDSEGNAIGDVGTLEAPLPGFTVTVSPIQYTLEAKPTKAMKNAFKESKSSKDARRK